jgi:ubiquinone/menaquinone biosynthesis C-methylase UbiE
VSNNIDHRTVAGFGEEWSYYHQGQQIDSELEKIFQQYFSIFPWSALPSDSVGFDLGCGSGRWARLVAPRVGHLHCIDASDKALEVAGRNLRSMSNCSFHHASVDEIPLPDDSMDFGYSLGVLHHVPDTLAGLRCCVDKLKPGAPFLVYLYYALDNRPLWFQLLWRASDLLRRGVSSLPSGARLRTTQVIAATVYWPLARFARLAEKAGAPVRNLPLAAYRSHSFYTMRTDALDRFGTQLEQRFTAEQIRAMMQQAGLRDIVFSQREPFWCAVGYRR